MWRHSRYDFNADYMEWSEAIQQNDLLEICVALQVAENFKPYMKDGYAYYRRGRNGIYLYRVLESEFRTGTERKKHEVSEP